MKTRMAGIDHYQATLAQRETFAFSRTQAQAAMEAVIRTNGINGCVIISTCNRTELWISEDPEQNTDLTKMLCALKGVSPEANHDLFTIREGTDAMRHLFETACGLQSQVFGEDQILSQIKDAIELARAVQTTDEVLEKLFQTAITCAKKIKSTIRLTAADVSIATKALQIIHEHFPDLHHVNCLVLGNGEVGRRMASLLIACGARVTVTLREYKHAVSIVPEGCLAVSYEKGIAEIKQADLIVSATSSPHYIIKSEDISDIIADQKHRVFIDLAVPRDIHPQIARYNNVSLIDIEILGGTAHNSDNNPNVLQAKKIISRYMIEFMKWDKIRAVLPLINDACYEQLILQTQKGSPLEKEVTGHALKAIEAILNKRNKAITKALPLAGGTRC